METIKAEAAAYWTRRAGQFASLRLAELDSGKRRLWTEELLRYLPRGRSLRVLDVGTGSGFFAVLLAALGHQVTGIDLTEKMIEAARNTVQGLGLEADLRVMDAERPDFPDRSFDVVVSRNLTWNLPHLEEAYAQWRRVLKPGGLLLNFDGDYCREKPLAQQALPENHAHKAIGGDLAAAYEHLKTALEAGQQPRPAWDVELLRAVGFRDVSVDTALSQRVYSQVDEFYNPTPMFAIRAVRDDTVEC